MWENAVLPYIQMSLHLYVNTFTCLSTKESITKESKIQLKGMVTWVGIIESKLTWKLDDDVIPF